MTPTNARKPLTLAIHPSVAGFGWAVFEGPLSPHDWGGAQVAIDKNAGCLKRIEILLDRFLPETLVLEAFEHRQTARRERITKLCRGIVAMANGRGIDVSIFSRDDVRATFAEVGARSRQEIAEAVGRQVDLLRRLVPKKRRAWESEAHVMAVFNAAAVALTHYRLSCHSLLDDLRDNALS